MNEKIIGLKINEKDNVAVIFGFVPNGGTAYVNDPIGNTKAYMVHGDVKYGHKIALIPIKKGSKIIKYGEVIGGATQDIPVGMHVHVENVESLRARGDWKG